MALIGKSGILARGFLAALLLAATAARGETIELIDGRRIQGKVIRTTDTRVHVRTAPNFIVRIDRKLIAGIYKDGEPLPPTRPVHVNPGVPPREGWPRPFGQITIEAEQRLAARTTEILAGAAAQDRAKLYGQSPEADRRLLPAAETLEQWLASPRKYPDAEGKPLQIDLPWKGENPRAIAVVGVPAGYDPRKQAWPLLIALHGTDDTPDAMVSHMRPVLREGVFLVAPRTLAAWQLWYHRDNIENIFRILGHVASHYRIDPRRIVICGGSGGGMGTWGIACNYPELFCAAGSSAGMPPIGPESVPRLATVPFFIMHGKQDHIPVAGPRKMHEAMEAAKIEHVYFEHEGGHYPTAEQWKRFREWLAKAPPKRQAGPRPALLLMMRRSAEASPLPAPAE